ncbi:hypothetical protein [Shinella sp. DD12]|uniref:hypothetical protein n=1 Tax=Shinella sp. DD12 TaxID=1410620 RepID=UPI000437B73F|nr:hypothetical protein [Shinella sp. DD12]EYR81867.1 hypothetical protein SHLA_4c001590 [Shinella sp. DD12]
MNAIERWSAIMALPEYNEQLHAMAALLFKDEQLSVEQVQATLAVAKRSAPAASKVETPESYDAYRARMAQAAGDELEIAGARLSDGRSAKDISTKALWAKAIAEVNARRQP